MTDSVCWNLRKLGSVALWNGREGFGGLKVR